MAGYVRQSVADIVSGADVLAAPLNAEFNALQGAFQAVTGHTHSGGTGQGPKLSLTAAVSDILPVPNGGTGLATLTASRFLVGAGTSVVDLTKVVPTGTVVGTTDTQTLTNKTISVADASFSILGSVDATKIIKFEIDSLTTATTRTITIPDADLTVVGTSTTQTLTNKTITSPIFATGASFSASSYTVAADTTDGSDTKAYSIVGGGALSSSRGAYLVIAGNENTGNPGNLVLQSGATGNIIMGGPTAHTGNLTVSGTTTSTLFSGPHAASDLTGTVASARISGSYTGITGVGALDAGSITSNFGSIDIGTSSVTTGGLLSNRWSSASAGTLVMRPNGVGSNVGSATLDTSGTFTVVTLVSQNNLQALNGSVTASQNVTAGGTIQATGAISSSSTITAGGDITTPFNYRMSTSGNTTRLRFTTSGVATRFAIRDDTLGTDVMSIGTAANVTINGTLTVTG